MGGYSGAAMKFLDAVSLLFFKPLPAQFEPVPWRGPVPNRSVVVEYYTGEPVNSAAGKGWHFNYSDHSYEFVSHARVAKPYNSIAIFDPDQVGPFSINVGAYVP